MKSIVNNVSQLIQAMVWICFGLFGKLLPTQGRHEQIVETIFGLADAKQMITIIGIGEVCLALLILSGMWRKQLAIFQIVVVLSMNVIELHFAKQFLLFGVGNLVLAVIFCLFIYYSNISKKIVHYFTNN